MVWFSVFGSSVISIPNTALSFKFASAKTFLNCLPCDPSTAINLYVSFPGCQDRYNASTFCTDIRSANGNPGVLACQCHPHQLLCHLLQLLFALSGWIVIFHVGYWRRAAALCRCVFFVRGVFCGRLHSMSEGACAKDVSLLTARRLRTRGMLAACRLRAQTTK